MTPGQDTERQQPLPASEALVAGDAEQGGEGDVVNEAVAAVPGSSSSGGSGSGSENGGGADHEVGVGYSKAHCV